MVSPGVAGDSRSYFEVNVDELVNTPGGWLILGIVFLIVAVSVIDLGRKRK